MEIILKYGIIKKNQLCLYEHFDDTLTNEFRSLKGRYYKKNNFWSFPRDKIIKKNISEPTIQDEEGTTSIIEPQDIQENGSIIRPLDEEENGSMIEPQDEEDNISIIEPFDEEDNISIDSSIVHEYHLSMDDSIYELSKKKYKYNPPDYFYEYIKGFL